MTKAERHQRYHSVENWGTQEFSEREQADIERHENLIGPPITVPLTDHEAIDIALSISTHWRRCVNLASQRFAGQGVLRVFEGMYQGLIFGQNTYVEGSSGTAKTETMRFLCRMINAPFGEFDASADTSDLNLLGGEIPGAAPGGGIEFRFQRGPVLKPGSLGLMIDELPRLPANASNVLLQAMAEKRSTVSLVATGEGDHTILLSPNFFVLGVGNPIGYGGQGERSLALYDRFGIGLYMPQPKSEERVKMYERFESGQDVNLQVNIAEPDFTFNQAHAALYRMTLDDTLRQRLAALSFAISPEAFRKRVNWNTCFYFNKLRNDKELKALINKERLSELKNLVEDYLAEGSNPRGELHAIRNAPNSRFNG
jgi:MoxR-like ATPase